MAESHRLIIPTSEGRLIEIEEGALDYRPPPQKQRKASINKKARKKQPPIPERIRFTLDKRPKSHIRRISPDMIAYNGRRLSEACKYKSHGRKLGHCDGYSRRDMHKILTKAKVKAKEDLAKIEAAVGPIEDNAAKEALQGALEVLRTPTNQTTKLQAARLVLDFTRAKPASKSEVTVNAAEQWLASLDTK